MNTPVASCAPKGKHHSTTNSIIYRVSIAAGIHILHYEQFLKEIASLFEFELYPNIIAILQASDKKKGKRRAIPASMDDKK